MSTHPRSVLFGTTGIALLVGLAIGAGTVLAAGPSRAPTTPAAAPSVSIGAPPVPSMTDTTTLNGTTTGAGRVAAGGGTSAAGTPSRIPTTAGRQALDPTTPFLSRGSVRPT